MQTNHGATPRPYEVNVSGTVDIAPDVVMSRGTTLKADPGSRLILMAGVCLGPNTLIHARWGELLIEAEAVVGADGLIVGYGQVGAAACIGGGSTLLNPQIQPHQVIPPHTYWSAASPPLPTHPPPAEADPGVSRVSETGIDPKLSSPSMGDQGQGAAAAANGASKANGFSRVYGRDQVDQLLDTLFPHRRSLTNAADDDKS